MVTSMPKCNITPFNVIELLQNGTISCVLGQDWVVNRIAPDFINYEDFETVLGDGKRLLHLGIGDGECYRYFDKGTRCIQSSISDRLYIDPFDIILLYLKRCNLPVELVPILSNIMRSEYLLSISYYNLFEENKDYFSGKDLYISEMLTQKFCQVNCYSFSYNVILLLIHILNTSPSLLLPDTSVKRLVTPMGRHIISQKITGFYLLQDDEFAGSISIDDVAEIAIERFAGISDIFLSDFEKVAFSNDIQYDYILARRSDAHLRERYAPFVMSIIKHVKNKGFYISDGILGSYSYEVFYHELNRMIAELGKDRVFLVRASKCSQSLPLKEISGIVIAGNSADIECTRSFISSDRLISAYEITNDESFLKQCIWSDLFAWASTRNIDLENFRFDDINYIVRKYVDSKKRDLYWIPDFSDNEIFARQMMPVSNSKSKWLGYHKKFNKCNTQEM